VRIAFYAPLKPVDHPIPSGDRLVARLLVDALRRAGHEVVPMARLRSWDGGGEARRQARLERLGGKLARRLIRRIESGRVERPDLWLTYHLYHKAPDWIGPAVAAALSIPYGVVEASVAGKRAAGRWARPYRAVLEALGQADLVIGLNPADAEGVRPHLRPDAGHATLPPFLDGAPFAEAARDRERHRRVLAQRLGLDAAVPWLVAVGMMRPGDKLVSYRQLGVALDLLKGQFRHPRESGDDEGRKWHLLVVGDGAAKADVETALGPRATLLGALEPAAIVEVLAAADLMVWPAHNEAFGMALLEAQAAGLPVIAGNVGGVSAIVEDGETGILVPPGDIVGFAQAIAALLDDPARCRAMGEAAAFRAAKRHGLDAAARELDRLLRRLVP